MSIRSWIFRRPWLVIAVAFVALATVYSVVTPIFEAGDEIWHYPFVQYLATGNSLPVQDPAVKTLWEQEGGQPPLYYALGAALTSWIDTSDLSDRLWENPHAKIGIPLVLGNKNLVVHTSAESFPWHNTALAVHLLRFFSILLSTGTVLLTYRLMMEIKPDRRLATLAAAIVAFNPMFLFISASVNNDNLATFLATLALVLFVRLLAQGPTLKRFVILGLVLGLASLSKVSDLGLLVIAGVVFLYLLWKQVRETSWSSAGARGVIIGGLVCAAIVVVMAVWWYVRNWFLYGDPLAFNVWVAIAGPRPTPATLATLVSEFEGFRISFWGNFGGVNIIAPGWVYTVLDIVSILGIIGLAIGVVRRSLPRIAALPALWLILIVVSLVRWTWLTLASQGRLIFPAIAAVALLLTLGLNELRISRLRLEARNLIQPALGVFLFLFSILAPWLWIAPAYALPIRLPDDKTVPNPVHISFEDQAELVGYSLPVRSISAGQELPLTLYWRTDTRLDEDYSVYIHLFDLNGNQIGQWDAYPGGGVYPTRLWQPGEVVVDTYRVPVSAGERPQVGRVEAGLYHTVSRKNLVARDPQGQTVTPTLGRFKVAGFGKTSFVGSGTAFGRQLDMAVVNIEDRPGSLQVVLGWRARQALTEDYTVFIHLLDQKGNLVAQVDEQPQHNSYPTSFWDAGEAVVDEHLLALPDNLTGEFSLEIGVYRADGTRLITEDGKDAVLVPVRLPSGR